MNLIQEQKWGVVNTHTWDDLSPHWWYCFRQALMDTEAIIGYRMAFFDALTEMEAQGVRVDMSPVIMETFTDMIVNIVVSKRDYYGNMKGYLPWYERQSAVFDEILKAYNKEFRRTEQDIDIVDRNLFIDTAIEKLSIYERDLGLMTSKSLDFIQRRQQISAKFRAVFDQTTDKTIKEVALAYSNGEIELNTTDTDGIYEIVFAGTRIPLDLDGFKKVIDDIIPAHLGIIYTLTGNIWELLKPMTWGEAGQDTWMNLITWEG